MVPVIRKILFTSDLSETSRHAFSYALSLASRYRAQIVFLYVMEEISPNIQAFIDIEAVNRARRQAADDARAALLGKRRDMATIRHGLQQFYETTLKDLENAGESVEAGDVIVSEGKVVETILQTAREQNCDAIVLGSRRRSALSEAMLGSVARGVLRGSDCLVVVAPPLKEAQGD